MADNKLYRHSTFSSKEGAGAKSLVLIAAWDFLYLCFLVLYLQDTCGNEKLPAAILTSSALQLGAEMKLFEKVTEYPSCKILNKCVVALCHLCQ